MPLPTDKWFVERFHLRSPVEEFEEYCRTARERLAEGVSAYDDSTHREAVGLVLQKLRPDNGAAGRTLPASDSR